MKLKKILCAVMTGVVLMSSIQITMPVYAAATTSVDITVGIGSGYDFNTIQDAVNSITTEPTEKYPATIYVDKGVYNEVVTVSQPYVNIINKGNADDVVITYDRASGHEDSTKNFGTEKSATFTLTETAVGFKAENITFVNSYNIDDTQRTQTQAVAVMTMADKAVFNGCKFIGRQDTLYLKGASQGQTVYGQANPARVYLKDCYVEGTVDFIFGDATAYFDNCNLFMAFYENGGHFTAANTTLFNIGYVFNKCTLSVDKQYTEDYADKIDLGRPWQADASYKNFGSATTYINCKMPDILKAEGFSLWDSLTVENKIRYMEYGSTDKNGKKLDLSQRADFVKILTDEQAQAYTSYNVLCGDDGWNPAGETKKKVVPADITLNEYSMSIPQNETAQLTPIVLPNGGNVTYYSENEAVAAVDETGTITGLKQGKTKVYAQTENGFSVYTNVVVTAPRTDVPKLNEVTISHKDTITPGDTLTVNYSYALDSDNAADKAMITWYAVKGNKTVFLQSGTSKTYTVANEDAGYYFKAVVEPATTTTYGRTGEAVSAQTTVSAEKVTNVYVREGFETQSSISTDGSWDSVTFDGNTLMGIVGQGGMDISSSTEWKDTTFTGKFRFNPDSTGWTAEDSFDLYTNYTDEKSDYYRLNIVRGTNTKSLKVYIYKNAQGEETLLAKDETTLKNNIYQNSGEENPYFFITLKKDNGNIEMTLKLEGENANLLKLSATDSEPLSGGYMRLNISGKDMTLLVDRIAVEKTAVKENTASVRVFLAGDSTVKDYGDDDSIGGWGEYIVNYFTDNVEVVNKAEGGRSVRSYLNQGRLDEILNEASAGDYLFIQFGHNDARTDENAYVEHSVVLGEPDENGIYPTVAGIKTATPQRIVDFYADDDYPYQSTFYSYDTGTFKWYYKQYVERARQAGMIPVVITPVCRVFFDSEGKITPHFGEDNGYVEAVRQVAEEMDCAIIDAYKITSELYESYGVLTTQTLHDVKDDGTMDLTHYNKFGANIIASKMSQALSEQNIPIAKDTQNSSVAVSKVYDMKEANLFILGDSGAGEDDEYLVDAEGFGGKVGDYFVDKITTYDLTLPNAGAKSYLNTDEYKFFKENLKSGDYVMICFGKNEGDGASYDYLNPNGNVDTENSFKNVIYNDYVKVVSDASAVPIIITPYAMGTFNGSEIKDTVGVYDEVLKEIVVDYGLYFVDITSQTTELYNNMGEDGSKVLNAIDSQGIDRDALSQFGADTVARMIVNSMKYSSATLKNYIDDTKLSTADILTKGEFVTYLMNVIGKTGKAAENYADVPEGKFYTNAVGLSMQYNITKADKNGNFYPENAISADEMTDMIEKAVALTGKNVDLTNVYSLITGDAVSNEIGLWAIDKIYEALN